MAAMPARGHPAHDAFDPRVAICEEHARPAKYAGSFAARARSLQLADPTEPLPAWWSAARDAGAQACEPTPKAALAALAASAPIPESAPEPAES